MTFVIKPSVDTEANPSDVTVHHDALHPDVVISTVLSLTELSAPSLNLQVGTGECYIHGYHVEISVAETKALSASQTHEVYIQLTRNGNDEVTGAEIASSIDDTVVAADSMHIATVVTDGTNITSITSKQALKDSDGVIYLKEASAIADPENTEDGKLGIVDNDSNNQKVAFKAWANGAIQEIIVW